MNPSKYTPENAAEVCRNIEMGFNQETAGYSVGVDGKTITNWRAAHPEFNRMYMQSLDRCKRGPLDCLRRAGLDDPEMALKYLSRRFPKEWGTFDRFAGSWDATDRELPSTNKLSGDELTAALEKDDRIKKGK